MTLIIMTESGVLGAVQYLMYNRAGAKSFLEPKNVKIPPSQVGKNRRTLPICIRKSVGPVGAMSYPDEV